MTGLIDEIPVSPAHAVKATTSVSGKTKSRHGLIYATSTNSFSVSRVAPKCDVRHMSLDANLVGFISCRSFRTCASSHAIVVAWQNCDWVMIVICTDHKRVRASFHLSF